MSLASSGEANAADAVLRHFAAGSAQNAVGIVDAGEDSGPIDGPQALTTDEKGNIYLLDQVNARILTFDPKTPSAEAHILQYPDQLRPTDLLVRKSDILVWDGSVHTLEPASKEPGTRGLEETSTRAADDPNVASAFAQMGSMQPSDPTDLLNENTRAAATLKSLPRPRQYVASRGAGSVVVDIVGLGDSAVRLEVRKQGDAAAAPMARLNLRVRDRLGAVEFLEIDHSGRMYVFAENIPVSGGMVGAFVARYAPAGTLEGVYELPLSNVPLSRRFVTVSGEGDVYFLRTQSTEVEVLGLGFRRLPGAEVVDIRTGTPLRPSTSSEHGPVAAVRPLTRQRVIETAFAFEGIQWTVNTGNYGRDPDTACAGFANRVRRPWYLQGKLGQQVRGVPYCWGCMGSFEQIRSKLERGALAGNICTHSAPRSDTVGVDCSAFVSAAWGLATHFTTSAIPAITQPISNPMDLRPGDALDKPGSHVMLFLRFTSNHMAEVIEASGACNARVCRNVYPLASLLARGYIPVRYRALANDTSVVAEGLPSEKPVTAEKPTSKQRRRK